MTTFRTEDDVLTLLIHLGYLGYEEQNKYVFIPNAEVQSEYASAVTVSQWGDISKALKNSADLLQAVWEKQETQVAEGIRLAHFETSQLQYNDENALSYTISLALYAARNFYTVYRELPGGKGFADLVFVPRKRYQDKPALVVELKWDKTAEGALAQIKDKEYCRSLEEYQGNLLLVGINYNKKTKKEIVEMLLKKKLDTVDEADLINMLIDEPIAIDVDKQEDSTRTFGDKLADKLTEIAGSWKFIIGMIIFLLNWILLNLFVIDNADPYPFILLNLILSCIAALQAPIIMMSQNREAKKDSLRSSNDYKTDLKSELILEELHNEIKKLAANQNKILKYIEEQEKNK